MNVLFWTTSFPNYSETFIKNQIEKLIDSNINVSIFANTKNKIQKSTKECLKSNLLDRATFKNSI